MIVSLTVILKLSTQSPRGSRTAVMSNNQAVPNPRFSSPSSSLDLLQAGHGAVSPLLFPPVAVTSLPARIKMVGSYWLEIWEVLKTGSCFCEF